MYDKKALQRKIKKEGVDKTIYDLSTGNFSEDQINQMTAEHIFSGGYPNLSQIYALA